MRFCYLIIVFNAILASPVSVQDDAVPASPISVQEDNPALDREDYEMDFMSKHVDLTDWLSPKNYASGIPRIVWLYWNTEILPPLSKACYENIKALNPDYEVHLLSKTTWQKYIKHDRPDYLEALKPTQFSDWIRLALLVEHGGIWIDITSILLENLDWVEEKRSEANAEGIVYMLDGVTEARNKHITKDVPALESWFIASVPNGRFITAWFEAFHNMVHNDIRGIKIYKEHKEVNMIGNCSPNHDLLESCLEYFRVYVAVQKVMANDRSLLQSMVVLPSQKYGPFYAMEAAGWKSSKTAKYVATTSKDQMKREIKEKIQSTDQKDAVYLIKFTSPFRYEVDKRILMGSYTKESIMGEFLGKYLPKPSSTALIKYYFSRYTNMIKQAPGLLKEIFQKLKFQFRNRIKSLFSFSQS